MNKQEAKQFYLFLEELKKYQFVEQGLALLLLRKYTLPLRKYFFTENQKLKYYGKYWFKIACKKGILENRFLGYKVLVFKNEQKI